MAKLEIPSIVVQSGSHTPPAMDRSTTRTQWSLSTQSTYDDDSDPVVTPSNGESDHGPAVERENEVRTESQPTNNNILPRSRSKANLKLLKRSHAIKESTSPPPDVPLSPVSSPTIPTSAPELPTPPISNNNNNNSTVNNNGLSARPTIKRESSNQSTDSNWSSSLSRGNSIEQQYTEQSGMDIEQFIIDTLNKNSKDRIFLLRVENELVSLVKDPRKNSHKFGAMSSYQRMLVHRVAHYFGMEHNVDSTGHMVVVNKGKSTRLPENKFNDFIRDDVLLSEEPRRSILKRESASFEENGELKSPDRHSADTPRRSKSFEEREEEYEKARRRIFHQEHGDHNQDCSQDCEEELRWPQLTSSWERTESSDLTKLHPNSHRTSRLTKVESYESRDTLRANSLRSSVSKSYSFGGYDQTPPSNKVLTKQDSGSSVSSRVSPSSSGYKSQSQRSDTTMSATPSPTATPHLTTQLSNQSGALSPDMEQETVLWAVTNMASVPAGSILINPQTGQPIKNEDGSVYHYDPDNPPTEIVSSGRQTYDNGVKREPVNSGTGRRSHSETNGPSEPPTTTSAPLPPMDSAPAYHQQVDAPSHQECESSAAAVANHHLPAYQQMPPPPPAAPVQHVAPTQATYTAPMAYNPPTGPYNVMIQPPQAESYPAPPANPPIMYSLPPAPLNQQYAPSAVNGGPTSYDRSLSAMDGASQDLCGYLMGLSLGEMGRTDPLHRPVFYCHPSGHFSQPPGPTAPAVPVYFTPANTGPPSQPTAPATRYPCGYAQYPPPNDRPATECNYPQPPVNAYYSRCPSNPQVGGAPSYCATNGGTAGGLMGLVMPPAHAQPVRPYHRMPTPPNTPQNGCPQYPMYSNGYTTIPGCYPHYQSANPPSQIPLPPMMRPALQLNMGNSPPLRAMRAPTYNTAAARSPVVRDSAPSEPQQHSSSPLRYTAAAATPHAPTPIPVYRFTYPSQYHTNELILLNTTRTPFTSPATAGRCPPSVSNNIRRQRCSRCPPPPHYHRKPLHKNQDYSNDPVLQACLTEMSHDTTKFNADIIYRPRPVGPTPNSRPVFAASQQQAALATAIEAAGLGVQTGGRSDWRPRRQ